MKLEEINIRDPFILFTNEKYYLYGTRAETCWTKADGFDCYQSDDLVEWNGPVEIFQRPENFWADRCFWAPECWKHNGKYYLITTFANDSQKGIQILQSDRPDGSFAPVTNGPITPATWKCIDGTLYIEDEKIYLVFSHSFEDVKDGDMCIAELSSDMTCIVSDIVTIFKAKDAPWAKPVPFAREEFGIDGDIYFSDGPFVYRTENGQLSILWSSWGTEGYTVGQVISESGNVHGPWTHIESPVFAKDGGHGMFFRTREGEKKYTLHYPNSKGQEHPIFLALKDDTPKTTVL